MHDLPACLPRGSAGGGGMNYDVVVVGAGPAGSMAAMEAARQGARTLIIERRQETGSPVRCAEGVGKGGLLKTGIKIDRRWIAKEERGARQIGRAHV